MKLKLFFCSLFFLFFSLGLAAATTIKLGTATEGGGYDILAESIQEILKKEGFSYDVEIVNTSGSSDNIHRLESEELDLAIVQNDTAFLAENGLGTFDNPAQSLRMIIALYEEPIYLVTNIPKVNRIKQLSNVRINIGLEDSGLFESVRVLLKSAGVWDGVKRYHFDEKKSLELLNTDQIQAVFLNHLGNDTQEQIDKNQLFLVPISTVLIKKLRGTFPYFTEFSVDGGDSTLAVRSILIGREGLEDSVIHEISNLLYKNYQSLEFPAHVNENLTERAFANNPLNAWHSGTESFFKERGIEPIGDIENISYLVYLILAGLLITPVLLFLIFSILYSMDMLFSRTTIVDQDSIFNSIKLAYLKVMDHKYALFFSILMMTYLACVLLVKYFDHLWALQNNIFSGFDVYPLHESLLWVFIFSASGYEGDIFPVSPEAKFLVSLMPLVGFGGIVALIGLVTSEQIKKYFLNAKGLGMKKDRNHIILCGWNGNAHFIVENLLHKNIMDRKKVVILADIKHKPKIDDFEFDVRNVSYVAGSAGNRNDLRRSNVAKADIAIIIPEDDHEDMDARVILNVLTIEKFCLELEASGERKNKADLHTIAQITAAENEQIARDAGANQIISLGNIESKIFTQAVHNPGVAKFVNEIFTYNDENDIYSLTTEEDSKLLGKTYDEILSVLRDYNILLLSINTEFRIRQGGSGTGPEKMLITNPFRSEESEYRVKPGDLLIVIAQYEGTVLEAAKALNR